MKRALKQQIIYNSANQICEFHAATEKTIIIV